FRRTPVERLPRWAAGLMLTPVLLMGLFVGMGSLAASNPVARKQIERAQVENERQVLDRAARATEVYSGGTHAERTRQRVDDVVQQIQFLPFFSLTLLGFFLLGAWFVRSGTMTRPADHLPRWRRMRAIGLGVGVPLATLAMLLGYGDGLLRLSGRVYLASTVMAVAALLLSFGY